MADDKKLKEALALLFHDPDEGEDTTIGEYFKTLLAELLDREESFSGKRPFGNSGWRSYLAAPLVKAGIISGKIDDEGYADGYDEREFVRTLVLMAMQL